MALTNAEKQKAFRERMYAAGYKSKTIWVPIEHEGKKASLDRNAFILKIDASTAGWPKHKLNKFFREALKILKENC